MTKQNIDDYNRLQRMIQMEYENTGAIHTDQENDRFLPKHEATNMRKARSRMFDMILDDIEKNR
ncbi:MAG: hypothetical protein KAQ85_00205 [Thermodesulfovibrionia bacterium]|nr:hypothetical protein [Thermodesulfovibrionia bacterium]